MDRHMMGAFVAGDDVEMATPAVLYELGCPGCDLMITAKVGGKGGRGYGGGKGIIVVGGVL